MLTEHEQRANDEARHVHRESLTGWQPIETAPKDGVEFQAWCGNPDSIVNCSMRWWEPRCRYSPENGAFEIWGRVDYDIDDWDVYSHVTPTHWMPLPEPQQ